MVSYLERMEIMARKDNKGFSIVEIVIAITILSLLLVPIVTQISQTFKTNRQTRRQQLANDDAIYVMEDFQKSTLGELETKYSAPSSEEITCKIYDETGSDTGDTVKYTANIYTLSDVELGHENTVYTRKVIMDDLSLALLNEGYRMTVNSVELAGFEVNDEGNTVKYDSNGRITDVVCTTTTPVNNPNKVNLGNMQNMDSTKVAIIGGNAANFDAQAEQGFYSLALNKMKETDKPSWDQAMYSSLSDSVLNQYYNLDNTKKVTRIYIDQLTDDTGNDYYQVSVGITYKNTTVTDTANPKRWSDELAYNVYSQKFYMDECPAVYFEYQPYTAESSYGSGIMYYTSDDYLIVENYVDDAKIYLYKPVQDQMQVYSGRDGAVKDGSGNIIYDTNGNVEAYEFYTSSSGTTPVKIHICDEDGTKPATVYTNIKIADFDTAAHAVISDLLKNKETGGIQTASSTKDFAGELKKLSEDQRLQERIFTIRVYLTTDDSAANDISITGAKGEN